ncbi:HDOD domain-containing protein [Congregibacter variabilis]|uniref:HDOD domain-containing protein n=1 Tax=Congregibacter variabilis TaxID=3081200 RepID=A0ABZ0I6K1_9GAMM|nr:HDOD domain-containing protein [Congregibacter sp. IMCC43200]
MSSPELRGSNLRPAVVRLMEELPVLPICISTLTRPDVDIDDHIDDILALAKVEPCLTIRIFQLAAKHFPSRAVTSVQQALMLVGSRAIDELIEVQSMARPFHPDNDEERCMWAHFVHVSIAAGMLAKVYGQLGVKPEAAEEAGLLHDLGRLVHYKHLAKSPSEIEMQGYRDPAELLQAEEAVFGISHVALGSVAAEIAHAPAYIRDCIDHHHSKAANIPRKTSAANGSLIELVAIADEIAMYCHRRPADDEDEFAKRSRRFMETRSVYVKKCRPKLEDVYEVLLSSLKQTQTEYLRLGMGPPPQLEYMDIQRR